MRIFVFAMLALSAIPAPAAAKCHYDVARYYFAGDQVTTAGTATSGKDCKIHFSGTISAVDVTKPAQHGSATWNGQLGENRLTYRSNPGYRGPDTFAIAVHGARGGVEGISNHTVNMDVQ